MRALTTRQLEVLDYIRAHARREGRPPTMQEIGRALGMKSTAGVHRYVSILVERGHLSRTARESRGIAPARDAARVEPFAPALRVFGSDSTFVVDPSLTRGAEPDRLLLARAAADYADAAIRRGDLLVVERVLAAQLDAGDLVAVRRAAAITAARFRETTDHGVLGRVRAVVRMVS